MSRNKFKNGEVCKQSVYIEKGVYDDIKKEGERLGRSISWVLLRSWKIARKNIEGIPSDNAVPEVKCDES